MKKQLSNYQRAQVTGATQQELILMCYRGCIHYLRDAKQKLEDGEIDEFSELLEKAHRVIFHLYTTLDMEKGGEIAEKLAELYSYLINQLYLLTATKKIDIFDGVLKVLENLKEGWEQIGQDNNQDIADDAAEFRMAEGSGARNAAVSVQL